MRDISRLEGMVSPMLEIFAPSPTRKWGVVLIFRNGTGAASGVSSKKDWVARWAVLSVPVSSSSSSSQPSSPSQAVLRLFATARALECLMELPMSAVSGLVVPSRLSEDYVVLKKGKRLPGGVLTLENSDRRRSVSLSFPTLEDFRSWHQLFSQHLSRS